MFQFYLDFWLRENSVSNEGRVLLLYLKLSETFRFLDVYQNMKTTDILWIILADIFASNILIYIQPIYILGFLN